MENNLPNNGGELPDGVPAHRSFNGGGAEKFIECLPAVALAKVGAKSEKLSFWK